MPGATARLVDIRGEWAGGGAWLCVWACGRPSVNVELSRTWGADAPRGVVRSQVGAVAPYLVVSALIGGTGGCRGLQRDWWTLGANGQGGACVKLLKLTEADVL